MEASTTTAEQNAAAQRRLVEEAQGQGNLDVVDEILAEDFVDHTPFPGINPDRRGRQAGLRRDPRGVPGPRRRDPAHGCGG